MRRAFVNKVLRVKIYKVFSSVFSLSSEIEHICQNLPRYVIICYNFKLYEIGDFKMNQTAEAGIVPGTPEDFPMIYADLQKQFAPDEVYRPETYRRLLNSGTYQIALYKRRSDGALLGYALVYPMARSNVVWGDYLAILEEFHGQGIGQALFRALMDEYCGPYGGLMFSVERVSKTDPVLAETQRRRLSFYHKLGAHCLHAGYLQPTPGGSFPMHLYFKPKAGVRGVSKALQADAVSDMYHRCFSDLKHIDTLLPAFADTIRDESFTD